MSTSETNAGGLCREVEEQIARSIVNAVRVALAPEDAKPLVERPTADVEAYTLYLKGRYHWNKRPRESIHLAYGPR